MHSVSSPATYVEAPRSYWSLLYTGGAVLAGFVVDLGLGGGIAHLPGWLAALALLIAVHALVVHAARSEKTLRVTADEVRVGDEVMRRSDIAGPGSEHDEDAPVLGWPTGMPRGAHRVTLRLTDGRDVVVPARHPDRLRAALGLTAQPPAGPEVRAADRSEYARLAEIDERAETLFRLAGYDLPDLPFDNAALQHAKAVFVAGRPPIAFVWVDEVDGRAHVAEIAVVPKWMRKGVGTRLLDRACEWARTHGYPAITLTTYADVPWNGPYYSRRGFVELTELTPGLEQLRERERQAGLDDVGRRIVMCREL